MKISAQSYYGMKAISLLAREKRFFSVREISEKEHIPYDYSAKIMQKLTKAGLVAAKKGIAGGYMLKRESNNITAKDVLAALDEAILPILCLLKENGKNYCLLEKVCVSRNVWAKLQKAINSTLDSISLKDLVYAAAQKPKRKN